MTRRARHWGCGLAVMVTLAIASCSSSDNVGGAANQADAGASGAADGGSGGESADFAPAFYADAGAAGALPVCTTTDPAQCEVGEALVTTPDRYCPYCRACEMDEKNACPPYTCGSAAHNEMAPGQCCTTCVPNDAAACATQQEMYAEQRQLIVQLHIGLCKKDADCASVLINTPCEQTCGAALTDSAPAFTADLSALSCAACPLQPPVSVRPGGYCPPAICLKGLCAVVPPSMK